MLEQAVLVGEADEMLEARRWNRWPRERIS
jgi:hypothetical protein